MARAFAVAVSVTIVTLAVLLHGAAQDLTVLHITVTLVDASGKAAPVPRHALLISDNPSTAAPRRVVTGLDGTADVRLRPGNYTVESDEPVAFQGKAYQWTQIVDVRAGREAVLKLTAANAEAGVVAPAASSPGSVSGSSLSSILIDYQDSIVELWTPTNHASGFFVGANGLVATNLRAVGNATSLEVQLTRELKVAATLVASDAERDVAVFRVAPAAAASIRPVPLACAAVIKPMASEGQEIFTISAPLGQQKGPAFGKAGRNESKTMLSDIRVAPGSAGGPVFAEGGSVVGITAPADDNADRRRGDAKVVPLSLVCEVVGAAETKLKDVAPPDARPLPVEPPWGFPEAALKTAAQRRAGSLNPPQLSATDFDVAFITPLNLYGAQYQAEQVNARNRSARTPGAEPPFARLLTEFANWSDYVAAYPPVLLLRATPKLVEGVWTKVARGAAYTQGAAIPAIKHPKTGFLKMRTYCGDAEVTPIHPFRLEQRVSETETIFEGLYAFDPAALSSCASVKLVLYSEKEPEKADTRVVDPKIIQQMWRDFEPYRP